MNTKYSKYIKIFKSHKKFEKSKKLVWSRYYFDDYEFNKRVRFVLSLVKNYLKDGFVMEIKFWEENDKMLELFAETKNSYKMIRGYEKAEEPGIMTVDDLFLDLIFFEKLLQWHYNYEVAKEPALSIKVLLFFEDEEKLTIFDFYDDRGFIINYYYYY
jgi:hypothetical protein